MKGVVGKEFYLLSFSFNGIKNIEKGLNISFYKNTITKKFDRKNYKVKGIYGENGVGKSAVVTAVKLYKELMINKRFLRNETNDRKLPDLVNKKTKKADFEAEYLVKENEKITIYKFNLSIQKNSKNQLYEIVYESCNVRSVFSKYKLIYENNNGKLTSGFEGKFNNYITDISRNLLKESSFLSIVFYADHDDIFAQEIENFENLVLCHLNTYVYMDEKDVHNKYVQLGIAKEMIDNNENIDSISFTNKIDYLTCNKMTIKKEYYKAFEKKVKSVESFIKIFKPELRKINVDRQNDKDNYECELVFEYDEYSISGEYESTGIKKLVELYTAFKKADEGQIAFIDELDANIHDFYLCKLLEYVAEYAKGQMCFTTHNLGPMRVLKKYKKSIDFLSRNGDLVSWIKNGNYQVDSLYSKGLIDKSPFNLEAFQFLKVFGE